MGKWIACGMYALVKTALMVAVVSLPTSKLWKKPTHWLAWIELASAVVLSSIAYMQLQGSDPGYLCEELLWKEEDNSTDEQLLTSEDDDESLSGSDDDSVALQIRSHSGLDAQKQYRLDKIRRIQETLRALEKHSSEDSTDGTDGEASTHPSSMTAMEFCEHCDLFPPLRSHHCRPCGKCVATFDHHCFVLATCIGEKNHCRFWWFLFLETCEILAGLDVVYSSFRPASIKHTWIHANIYGFLLTTLLLIPLLFVGSLLAFHTFVAMTGVFYGVGSKVNPNDVAVVTDPGYVDGSFILEWKGWVSQRLSTMVFAIIVEELLGYKVSMYKTSDGAGMGQRMSSVGLGSCAPVHANVESWYEEKVYDNETYRAGSIGYDGRSGVYTTTDLIKEGDTVAPPNQFGADFWRDYRTSDILINRLSTEVDPAKVTVATMKAKCPDGTLGCKDGCSQTKACSDNVLASKKCVVVLLMETYYDPGYVEAVFANNKIPARFCFIGSDNLEQYVVDATDPMIFYHYEPDPFHTTYPDKFERVFLPRTRPENTALYTGKFGENGFGEDTDNPVSVDFPSTNLAKYASSLLQEFHPISNVYSRMEIQEVHMTRLMSTYVQILGSKVTPIVPEDVYYSTACAWLRENYPVWKGWMDRLPLCNIFEHMKYTLSHCDDAKPQLIQFVWIFPHPDDPTRPYNCDGGGELPPIMYSSRSCEWLKANTFVWYGWIWQAPGCDDSFYNYSVSECDARAKRTISFWWLVPDPTDSKTSIECVTNEGLPADVIVDCEYTPYEATIVTTTVVLAGIQIVVLLGMIIFVYYFRNEPIIKRSQWEFLIVMIIGGIMMSVAAVIYAGEPSRLSCGARPVVTSTGFTLIFGALVMKSLRVYRVFMSGAMKRVVLSSSRMFKMLGMFLLVDTLIFVVWFAVDFPAPSFIDVEVPQLGGKTIQHHVCNSTSFIYTALLIFWKAIVLFMGLYLSFLIRKVSADFQESIWIFSSSLVVLFGSIIVLPMAYLVELPAHIFYSFLSFALLGCTSTVMTMMLVPKIFRLHEQAADSTTTTTRMERTRQSQEDGTSSVNTESTEQPSSKPSRLRLPMLVKKASAHVTPVTPVTRFNPNEVGDDKSDKEDTHKEGKKKKKEKSKFKMSKKRKSAPSSSSSGGE
ncbi:hypothetical protein Poli38472_003715 [Pythium oligandrum]|uniref:G-protein coupled receptors family 3 profile domain-containing protein n=1 Tax=Pythium oligandrum TaxID=41045 RepID=A0A8K1CMD2_PYTOL|nr:hypothetical protein Poli38472_003715 [Pythium oligandrum]|eukprot:TMW65950.1 hypothetical protein Poli38472_003715 [Pythium oligandrum]